MSHFVGQRLWRDIACRMALCRTERLTIMGKLTPIRAWREHLGMTQAEVAARMAISQAAFAQFEASTARPRPSTLRRVAQALGIQLEQLDF